VTAPGLWTYYSERGDVLASVYRPDVPPLGYEVGIVGPEFGPKRHYEVASVKPDKRSLVLSEVPQ